MPQHSGKKIDRIQIAKAMAVFSACVACICLQGCSRAGGKKPLPAIDRRPSSFMHTGNFPSIENIAVSADGRYFITVGGDFGATKYAYEHAVRVWQVDKLTSSTPFLMSGYMQDIFFRKDARSLIGTAGQMLWSNVKDALIEERMVQTGKLITRMPQDRKRPAQYVALLNDGTAAAVSYKTGPVEIRSVRNWQLLCTLDADSADVFSMEGALEGTTLAIMHPDGRISIYDTAPAQLLASLPPCHHPVALSQDGSEFVYLVEDGSVRNIAVWSKTTGQPKVMTTKNIGDLPNEMSLSPDGLQVALWDELDGHDRIEVFYAVDGSLNTFELEQLGNGGDITATAFTVDGKKLLIGTVYGKIAILDLKSQVLKTIVRGDPSGDSDVFHTKKK